MRKRDLSIAGAIAVAVLTAGAADAQSQKFTEMNRQVEGFLTGLWAKTSAPADRPPNETEVSAAFAHCDESMIDPKTEDEEKTIRSLFPNEGAAHGDISMFRSEGAFILAERMQTPAGIKYSFPRKMTVGAVQQQNRIVVRFISHGRWVNGAWIDSLGAPALWADAMLGDLDVGGTTEHLFVLGKDNTQTTYVKCGS